MYKPSIVNKIREDYIDEYLECSKKINYTEIPENWRLTKVMNRDLPKTDIEGYPFASDYTGPKGKVYSVTEFSEIPDSEKKKCDLRYYYLPYSHELYVGTTGSGKSTGCVEPQLRAVSSQKNKPNLFLTDPKGELFDRNAKHLKNQGYRTFVLNFKDLVHSDKWNPLLELYDAKIDAVKAGKGSKMHKGEVKKGLMLTSKPEEYGECYIEYDGYAFKNGTDFETYSKMKRDYLEADVSSMINQLASMIVIDTSDKDRTWINGSQELFKGLLECMLDDATKKGTTFTRDMMNLRMVQQYYLQIKTPIVSGRESLRQLDIIKGKSQQAIAHLATALDTAKVTLQGFCSTFESAVNKWFQGHIFALTTGNTVDIENLKDPFAIFLITRDYEKDDFIIAGLFVDWVYRTMIKKTEKEGVGRAMHFLLDEFGNIPKIKDLENKIATARSRNIWFHLFVQSYQQINLIYGDATTTVILDNCNSQIFLGAQNFESKELFSKQCGKRFIETLSSRLDPTEHSITEAPLIPISDLDLIKPGQMYIKRLYMPVIVSQFVRSYICAAAGTYKDYIDADGLMSCTPISFEPFTTNKYTYSEIYKSSDEDDIDF